MPLKFRDHAWFAAFAPVEDPRIAVIVLAEHGGFGAAAAAPIAKQVFEKYFRAGGSRTLEEWRQGREVTKHDD